MPINEYDDLLVRLAPSNPYHDLLRDDARDRAAGLHETMRQAASTTPDARAEALQLADRYLVPVDLVERNLETFRGRAAADRPELEQLPRDSPALAQWLQDRPEVAGAAQDDLPQLQRLEHTLTFGASILRGVDTAQSLVGGFLEATGELAHVDRLARYGRSVREANQSEADAYGRGTSLFALRGPWDLAQWISETAGQQIPLFAPSLVGGATGAGIGSVVPVIGTTVGALIGAAVPAFVLGVGETAGTIKQIRAGQRTAPEGLRVPGTIDLEHQPRVRNADGSISTVDSISIGTDAGEVLLSRVTPDGRHLTSEQAIAEFRRTHHHLGIFDTAAHADAYAQQLHADYAAGAYDTGRGAAAAFIGGTAIAALDTIVPGHIGGRLVRTFGRETAEEVARRALLTAVKPTWLRATSGGVIRGMTSEGLTEALQQAIGAVAGAAGTNTALPQDLWQQVVDAGAAGGLMGGVAEGVTDAGTVRHEQARFAAARQQQVFFDGLATGVTESKLVSRLPAAAQEYLQRVTKDGPVEHVYAPVDTFDAYWRSKHISPDVMAAVLTGREDALEQARQAGTDLQIPTAAYAVKLAGTEHHGYFAQELRLDPQQLNAREATALEAQVAAAADVPPDARAAALDQGRETVRQRVFDDAIGAGARRDVAEAWAALHSEGYATMAQRLGVDPVQLFEVRRPPAIVADTTPAGERLLEIPASPATRNETAAQRSTRREAQLAALTSALTRDAQRLDPTVTPAVIRQELETRVALEEERQQLQQEDGHGQDLLRAIAGYGGLWWEARSGAYKGEVEHLAESRDIRATKAGTGRIVHEAGRATWNGVAGVFHAGGKSPDPMVEALREDPRFAYITDINDLFDAVDDALRAAHNVDALPGTRELRDVGVVPGTAWWRDAWGRRRDESGAIDESEPPPDVVTDTSFDPASFEQRGDLEARAKAARTAARLERLRAGELRQEDDALKGSFNPSTNVIRLIAGKADLSTFLHESGHAYLELLSDAAVSIDRTQPLTRDRQQLLDDADTVLRWVGFDGTLDEWRRLSVDERRPQHEQFARGFEAYLMEGKAPSAELRGAFVRFRQWLLAVYRSMRRLRVELNPEIRGVMDRLLATDDAIAAAEAEASVSPLFTDAASAGVDAATFATYRDRVERASVAAREELDRRVLREWQRERGVTWRDERERVRAGVVAEMNEQPAFVAQSAVRTGKMPDGSIPSFGDGRPLRLSKRDLVNQFGADVLKRLRGLYVIDGGIPVDTAAEILGFGSGDALVQALAETPPAQRVIDSETDARMRDRHPDLFTEPFSLRAAAEDVVADQRAAVIAAELQALTRGMAQASIPRPDVITAAAAERIARTKVRDLKPGLFLQAARRASRQAFDAFGRNDRAAAVAAKQQELVSLALYREATTARDRAVRVRRELSEYSTNTTLRARIGRSGQDYLDQIDGFLDRYEFAKVPQYVLDRRESLRKWVSGLEAQGLPIDLPDATLDDARRTNYQDLSVDELAGVHASVQQIAHLARLKTKLLKAAGDRELAAVTAETGASIRDHAPRRRGVGHETRLPSQAAGKLLEGVFAAHRKMASLARELDGFRDGGAMWEHIIRPINEAGNAEATMHADATRRLAEIFDRHFSPADRRRLYRRDYLPALGEVTDPKASLSKMARLMIALNWGNETNRQRMRDGRHWSPEQVQAILETLDDRDRQFVNDLWEYVDSYWPAIKAKQERVVGLAPEKVEASPFTTAAGHWRGGYFPIKFDGEQSALPEAHETAEIASLQKFAAYATATTRRGHTKARAEGEVTLPVRLDFGVIFEHVGQVVHDLTHHEALIDVGRIMRSRDVQQAILDTHGAEIYRQFRNGLRDVAFGDIPARDKMEQAVNHLRQGATVAGLGWNLTSALVQPLGLFPSMQRIGVKWVAKGLTRWLQGAVTMDHTVEWIQEQSEFMAARTRTLNREVNEIRNSIGLNQGRVAGWVDQALRTVSADHVTKAGIADSYFYLIGRMQLVADVPTWLGAYEKAMADPGNVSADGTVDEARAVALADQAVLDSQGGGQIKDLASVQRGSAWLKLWTNFYSAFNVTFNRWAESVGQARLERSPAAVGRLAVDYLLLVTLPATFDSLIRDALKGEDDPEEFLKHIALNNVSYMLGTMLWLRELGGAVQGYAGWEGPAGSRILASLSRTTKQLVTAVSEGDAEKVTATTLRSLNDAAGAVFHYPAGQVQRTISGLMALIEGKTANPAAVVVGAPKNAR